MSGTQPTGTFPDMAGGKVTRNMQTDVGMRPDVTVNVTLLAFAAERRAAAPLLLDISCPYGAQQQTCRTPPLRLNDGMDGTDGRTLDRFVDSAPHSVIAV